MKAFYIFMVMLVQCMSYHYDRSNYHPRYGVHKLSRSPFRRTRLVRTPSSRPPLNRTSLRRTQFGGTQFGGIPFFRSPFRYRFQPQPYRGKHYRDRSPYTSFGSWMREGDEVVAGDDEVDPTVIPKHPNVSLSVFRLIINKQNDATRVEESKYPWIARIIHTPEDSAATTCTAACIEERIFITAARCLFYAKVVYARVYYQGEKLQPLAIVLPSKQTQEMFDDSGLIVVNNNFKKTWKPIQVFYQKNNWQRTDDEFLWTVKPPGPWLKGIAIGHVREGLKDNAVFNLYELNVNVSPFLCNGLYNENPPQDSFFVPCYSICNNTEYITRLKKCHQYLAGEGHIVISQPSNDTASILGVATWAGEYLSGYENPPLPIGMTLPNSPAFKEQLECALKIKAQPETSKRFDTFCEQ